MRFIQVTINAGEELCGDEGNVCDFIELLKHPYCGLFSDLLDADASGALLRCEACLEADLESSAAEMEV